jgi:hypothetical protein
MRSQARHLRRCTPFFLPLIAALISLGCTQDANEPSMSNAPDLGAAVEPPGLSTALAAQERHTDRLLGLPGVVGTAVGLGSNGRAAVQATKVRVPLPGVRILL